MSEGQAVLCEATGPESHLPSPVADLARVYDEHVWQVYGFFAYRLRSRADAEDLTQLTFERAARAWPRFDARRSPVIVWLIAIARNLLIDHYRSNESRRGVPLSAETAGAAVVDGPETSLGISPQLAAALDQLTDRERELIGLRFGADMAGPAIASVTGLTLANVQQILSRALRRLRALLEADSSEREPTVPGRETSGGEGANAAHAEASDRQ